MLLENFRALLCQGGRVEEHAYVAIPLNAAALGTLAQDRRRDDIARLQFIDEAFAECIDQFGAGRPGGFRYQTTREVRRISYAGRMVLEGIEFSKASADPIGEDQTVARCTEMVRGRESVRRRPSRSACDGAVTGQAASAGAAAWRH